MMTDERFLKRIANNFFEWEKAVGLEEATKRVVDVVPDADWLRFMRIKKEMQMGRMPSDGDNR